MSELDPLADELVLALRAQLPETGFKLAGIEVHVGERVDVSPDELRQALARKLPGIEVKVTVVAALLKCQDCGAEYPADEHPCPQCGSGRAELVHGLELAIARAWGAAD